MMIKHFLPITLVFILCSCSDIKDLNNISRDEEELELAIPLVNTEFIISDLISDDVGPNNVSLKVDEQDRVTLLYNGDVVRRNKSSIFPAIPFFGVEILDSVYTVPIPFSTDQRVDLAVFGNSSLIFTFKSNFEEDVKVDITVPQLTKDGQVFKRTVIVPYEGTVPVDFISELFSVEGWTLQSSTNEISVNYDARIASGERVVFDEATLIFDMVVFEYVEGYFGNDVFDIQGDFIPIGVLDRWRSGGLSFEDPKVNIYVENSFGFPVRSFFHTMQVVTTTGEVLDMESEFIQSNIDFNYPKLDEVGEAKITDFSFDKDNSNIVELFKERVVRVKYDIDAIANPDNDDSLVGFISSDGYFLVNVDVELPLHGTVNNLVLQDSVDLDLPELTEVSEAELKIIIENAFPADVTLQGFILDENDNYIDSLFNEGLLLPAATVNGEGRTTDVQPSIRLENYSNDRLDALRNGKRILVRIKINTGQASDGPLWIYNDYGIKFKMGAKLKATL